MRGLEVLLLAASGLEHKDIAARMAVEVSSVRTHLKNAATVMGARSVSAVVERLQREAFEEARKRP